MNKFEKAYIAKKSGKSTAEEATEERELAVSILETQIGMLTTEQNKRKRALSTAKKREMESLVNFGNPIDDMYPAILVSAKNDRVDADDQLKETEFNLDFFKQKLAEIQSDEA